MVGGGAAGVFAAIACAEAAPDAEIIVLEKSAQFLAKVRISGGGRCNVTNACSDPREFARHYPRGEQPLIGAFRQFQASDTVAWLAARGVKLKTESDGRMFPVTDSSQTIVDCLLASAKAVGVTLRANSGVTSVVKQADGEFEVLIASAEHRSGVPAARRKSSAPQTATLCRDAAPVLHCDRLLLATGGCRAAAMGEIALSLGHTLEEPVPSLFTFNLELPWLRALAGVSAEVEITVPGAGLSERGAVLVTHWGLSGPAVLRLSAWGARKLHALDYRFPLRMNWLPKFTVEQISSQLQAKRAAEGARRVVNTPLAPFTARLWEALVLAAGLKRETRWAELTRAQWHQLAQQLTRTEFAVTGKSLNKDEFVTCGGVKLSQVNFKTMESRVCPGLHFAGELLDIDGLTGGFNFQAAWTTGWIAGRAMAAN